MAPDVSDALAERQKVHNFLNAARSGNLDIFTKLAAQLDNGKGLAKAVADVKDANDRGAFHFAAREGKTEVCKYLLEELKLDANVKDGDGETPLLHAARQGHTATAKYLLEHGADATIPSDLGSTALHQSAGMGDIELLKFLLSKGVDVDSQSDAGTPLIWAAGHAQKEAVEFLLEHHADDGQKPIQVAALRGNRMAVEVLLPVTSPIDSVSEWTVEGILEYMNPETSKQQEPANSSQEVNVEKDSNLPRQDLAAVTPEAKKKAGEAKSRGDEAFRREDFLLAVDAYTQAIDLDPTDATFLSNRSLCWIRLGQAGQALADAKACRLLRPNWPKACYREGAALRLLQRFDEAANAFYEGVQLEPENKELVNAFREAVEAGKKFYGADQTKS
ncbi:hypothetical protein Nepgr_001442 [Nepenthes gracilis]|uniref:Serine/threonine-protein kinase BSK1-like TPR repeats domain-containing protein n=1 Tax=Nepenthes gracilis TaxID=150966 RepID=A0AAD3P759_NEPGR|nr:hypothetical protein Nepgr_001442 [Nepenthes gracilis]